MLENLENRFNNFFKRTLENLERRRKNLERTRKNLKRRRKNLENGFNNFFERRRGNLENKFNLIIFFRERKICLHKSSANSSLSKRELARYRCQSRKVRIRYALPIEKLP